MSSKDKKSLKDEFLDTLDRNDRYIRKAGNEIKELGEMFGDSAKTGIKSCKSKFQDVIRKVTKKRAGSVKESTPRRPKPKLVKTARKELTEELDTAIWRSYYADSGYRFFSQLLVDYVKDFLDSSQTVEEARIGGYNSCIQPMITRMNRLEESMEDILSDYKCKPFPLENEELLNLMRRFASRAVDDNLDKSEGWELKEYIQAVRQYTGDLNEQLLLPYPVLEDI